MSRFCTVCQPESGARPRRDSTACQALRQASYPASHQRRASAEGHRMPGIPLEPDGASCQFPAKAPAWSPLPNIWSRQRMVAPLASRLSGFLRLEPTSNQKRDLWTDYAACPAHHPFLRSPNPRFGSARGGRRWLPPISQSFGQRADDFFDPAHLPVFKPDLDPVRMGLACGENVPDYPGGQAAAFLIPLCLYLNF